MTDFDNVCLLSHFHLVCLADGVVSFAGIFKEPTFGSIDFFLLFFCFLFLDFSL